MTALNKNKMGFGTFFKNDDKKVKYRSNLNLSMKLHFLNDFNIVFSK